MKSITGSLQAEVMDLVWLRGELTVTQAHEAIARRRKVTYTTVLSALQKLEKKGWVKHRSAGRAYVYSPARSRQQAHGRAIRDLLRATFGGDPRLLLTSLLEETSLSDVELKQLRQLIDQRRKGGSS